jgi:hypothetical protein
LFPVAGPDLWEQSREFRREERPDLGNLAL